jgi:outer membrane lipoprotein-sorting protein
VRNDDKMRIELTSPDLRTILRDGDRLYIYTPKMKRVEEYNLGKHRDLVNEFLLLGFGTSGQDLKKGYLIALQGEEMLKGAKVVHLELTPKSQDVRKQISKIELWVDQATWLPLQQQFFEAGTKDYFIVRYSRVVRNVNLADSRFRARWPADVTRVKPQG